MLNKSERAKLAKSTIGKTIPDLLNHNARASNGVKNAELIRFKPHHETPRPRTGPNSTPSKPYATADTTPPKASPILSDTPVIPSIYVIKSDTFDAVRTVQSTIPLHQISKSKICVLNMASALHPGGGVVNGALAQEESLCMRSTLYNSLDPSWYRLPDLACVYTPDVLVFRDGSLANLKTEDRFYCDVISVAAIKNPECIKVASKDGGEEPVYASERDKEVMVAKIRGLFNVVKEKGVTHLILGALGCGAYHNPPKEVAKMFKRVLEGDRKHRGVEDMVEVVFAIFDEGENLETFRAVFPGKRESTVVEEKVAVVVKGGAEGGDEK